jgi:hypothetical protein
MLLRRRVLAYDSADTNGGSLQARALPDGFPAQIDAK